MMVMPLHDEHRRRRLRNVALAVTLGALVLLFFLITIAKLSGNA